MAIDKAKGRDLLMGIQSIVNFKGDEEAVEVLEAAKAYAEKCLAEVRDTGKRGVDRREKSGMSRGE